MLPLSADTFAVFLVLEAIVVASATAVVEALATTFFEIVAVSFDVGIAWSLLNRHCADSRFA